LAQELRRKKKIKKIKKNIISAKREVHSPTYIAKLWRGLRGDFNTTLEAIICPSGNATCTLMHAIQALIILFNNIYIYKNTKLSFNALDYKKQSR